MARGSRNRGTRSGLDARVADAGGEVHRDQGEGRGTRDACETKCSAKAVTAGTDPSPECLATADLKLAVAFTKADGKGGCDVVGDMDAVRAVVDTCFANFITTIAGDAQRAAAKTKAVGKRALAEAKCRQNAILAGAAGPDPACTNSSFMSRPAAPGPHGSGRCGGG